jgi:DNA-binding transcriptional MerR regulator
VRVSELVEWSGVPLPTIKYYIRKGMLAPGESIGPRRADYDESHAARLRLIHALTGPAHLSLTQVKAILHIIDAPEGDITDQLARAMTVLAGTDGGQEEIETATRSYPRAEKVVPLLGEEYRADPPAVASLEEALTALENAGLQTDPRQLAVKGEHMLAIARTEIDGIPHDPAEAVQYSVLGTVLYEPVLIAIRRLAHQSIVANRSRGR